MMFDSRSSFPAPGRGQRRLRNYLLDSRFQLKYAGYLVGIALLLSAALGTVLWKTSQSALAQSQNAVRQGEEVVARGRQLLTESQKVSAVVQMNIIRDPDYSQNPALLAAFRSDAEQQDARLAAQQKALENQAQALRAQAIDLGVQQRTVFLALLGALGLLVILLGFAGIVVTHRVAGPIYKIKRQIRELGRGRLQVPDKLRRGDELVDFFETFETTVRNLRARQEQEIAHLDAALAKLEGSVADAELASLRRLRSEKQAALDA